MRLKGLGMIGLIGWFLHFIRNRSKFPPQSTPIRRRHGYTVGEANQHRGLGSYSGLLRRVH